MAGGYTSEANEARTTESEFMNSMLKTATMTITETDFATEATVAESDDEDSIVEADSQTNIDKTESATAGLTERVPTSRSSLRRDQPTKT
jgi:hypothetical protein